MFYNAFACYKRIHQLAHKRPAKDAQPLNKRLIAVNMTDDQYQEMKGRLQDLEYKVYGKVINDNAINENYTRKDLALR